MARTLDVYLQNDLVGHLVQDEGGEMTFEYVESWLTRSGATPLSQSLQLRKERFKRKECRGFLAGILQEESMSGSIGSTLGLNEGIDYTVRVWIEIYSTDRG